MRRSEAELLQGIAEKLQARPRGLFVAFEGGDGSGKTTQTKLLGRKLESLGAPLLITFEPGATELGQRLRELVMHGPEDVDERTEALLYAADRAYHVATMIEPALKVGTTVFTDRYIDSSVAYQGIGRGLGAETIRDLSLWATGGLLPDVVIVFSVDPQVGLSRIGREFDRLERAGDSFHEAVTAHYDRLIEADPGHYRMVDANGSVEETFSRLVETMATVLGVQT